MRRIAVQEGVDSGSPTACPPWIFVADDALDYYTKLVGRCGTDAYFREAEFVASRLGECIGANVALASPIFIPAGLTAGLQLAGIAVTEQWAVGLQRLPIEPATTTFQALVSRQQPDVLLSIVALHSWLGVGDHNNQGHNFFRHMVSDDLYSLDHCSALAGYFADPAGAIGQPPTIIDLGDLLHGVAPGEPSRKAVAHRVRQVNRSKIETILAPFPDDPQHPWLPAHLRPALADWLTYRQPLVADLIDV